CAPRRRVCMYISYILNSKDPIKHFHTSDAKLLAHFDPRRMTSHDGIKKSSGVPKLLQHQHPWLGRAPARVTDVCLFHVGGYVANLPLCDSTLSPALCLHFADTEVGSWKHCGNANTVTIGWRRFGGRLGSLGRSVGPESSGIVLPTRVAVASCFR